MGESKKVKDMTPEEKSAYFKALRAKVKTPGFANNPQKAQEASRKRWALQRQKEAYKDKQNEADSPPAQDTPSTEA